MRRVKPTSAARSWSWWPAQTRVPAARVTEQMQSRDGQHRAGARPRLAV